MNIPQNPNGQASEANSQPVVLPATQVQVDGLTDAQLRASAVPISDGGGSITVDGSVSIAVLLPQRAGLQMRN
jgi:hypothetical protein